jgi:hypothetical protein
VRIGFALLLFSARLGMCGECVLQPIKAEVKHSEVVFRGTITEVNDSQIVFAVQRVFKGRLPAAFAMANFATDCCGAPGFAQHLVKTGNELLVYAWKQEFFHEGLLTSTCSRTALIQNAAEDLRELGPGHPPTQCAIRGDPLHTSARGCPTGHPVEIVKPSQNPI